MKDLKNDSYWHEFTQTEKRNAPDATIRSWYFQNFHGRDHDPRPFPSKQESLALDLFKGLQPLLSTSPAILSTTQKHQFCSHLYRSHFLLVESGFWQVSNINKNLLLVFLETIWNWATPKKKLILYLLGVFLQIFGASSWLLHKKGPTSLISAGLLNPSQIVQWPVWRTGKKTHIWFLRAS